MSWLSIAVEHRPSYPPERVLALLEAEYGLRGELTPLPAEVDQNFRLDTDDAGIFVAKFANRAYPVEVVACQTAALELLADQAADLPLPRIVPNLRGESLTHIAPEEMPKGAPPERPDVLRAKELIRQSPVFRPCVFDKEVFPECEFENPQRGRVHRDQRESRALLLGGLKRFDEARDARAVDVADRRKVGEDVSSFCNTRQEDFPGLGGVFEIHVTFEGYDEASLLFSYGVFHAFLSQRVVSRFVAPFLTDFHVPRGASGIRFRPSPGE